MLSAKPFIVTSVPVPTLYKLSGNTFLSANTKPCAKSSTCKNSRIGVPEPQNATGVWLFSLASWNFLIISGSAYDACKSKLSCGPYKLVGIKLTKPLSYYFLIT